MDDISTSELISEPNTTNPPSCGGCKSKGITLAILFLINLLNYMDRFTLAGIPVKIQKYFDIQDQEFGFIQTSFIFSYMLLSPLFGYLGDRWKRKTLILLGLTVWTLATLFSSFIGHDYFHLFILSRCIVGVGEASYSTIAPTIISDLFVGDKRGKALALYYFAVPLGSGIGYVIGFSVVRAGIQWQWALRVTPFFSVFCMAIFMIFHKDPIRGQAERGTHIQRTSLKEDLKYLMNNTSFVLITGMFTCVCFVIGSLTWWAVKLIESAVNLKYDDPNAGESHGVSLIFGISVMLAGIFGVILGEQLSSRLRRRWALSDVYVCIFGQIISAPLLYFALISASNFWLTNVLVFFSQLALCLQWSLVSDITMSVIIPTRRSLANALQMLFTHLLGDALSPIIVGSISQALNRSGTLEAQFMALRNALFLTPFISVLGGGFAILAAKFVYKDKQKVASVISASRFELYHEVEVTPDESDSASN